jgi:hypothetical protein
LAIGFEEWISKQKKPKQPVVLSPVPTFFNSGLISMSREKGTTDLYRLSWKGGKKMLGWLWILLPASPLGGRVGKNLYHPEPGTHGHS